jgi:hypothetical protein
LKYVAGAKPAENAGHRKKDQLLIEKLADARELFAGQHIHDAFAADARF